MARQPEPIVLTITQKGAKPTKAALDGVHMSYGEVDRAAKGAIGATSNLTKEFAKMSQGLGGLVHVYATVAANVFALTAAFNGLRQASQVTTLFSSMNALTIETGRNMSAMAKGMRDISGGALAMEEAMRASAQGATAGFGSEEMERITNVAKGASKALGRSLPESLDRLTRGLIKVEPELLDELGIMVRVDDAVREYARTIGKSASSLTGWERRQAFVNAALKEGEEKFNDIAEAAEANPYDKISASVIDLANDIGGALAGAIAPLLETLAGSGPVIAGLVGTIASRLSMIALPDVEEQLNGMAAAVERANSRMAQPYAELEDQIEKDFAGRIQVHNEMLDKQAKAEKTFANQSKNRFNKISRAVNDLQLDGYKRLEDGMIASQVFGDEEKGIASQRLQYEAEAKQLIEDTADEYKDLQSRSKELNAGEKKRLKNLKTIHTTYKDILDHNHEFTLLQHDNNKLLRKHKELQDDIQKARDSGETTIGKHVKWQDKYNQAQKTALYEISKGAVEVNTGWKGIFRSIDFSVRSAMVFRKEQLAILQTQGGLNAQFRKMRVTWDSIAIAGKAVTKSMIAGMGRVLSLVSSVTMWFTILSSAYAFLKKLWEDDKHVKLQEKHTEALEEHSKVLDLVAEQQEKFNKLLDNGRVADAHTQNLNRIAEAAASFGRVLKTEMDLLEYEREMGNVFERIHKKVLEMSNGRVGPGMLAALRGEEGDYDPSDPNQTGLKLRTQQEKAAKTLEAMTMNASRKEIEEFNNSAQKLLTTFGLMIDATGKVTIQNKIQEESIASLAQTWEEYVSRTGSAAERFLTQNSKAMVEFAAGLEEVNRLLGEAYLEVVPDTGLFRLTQQAEKMSEALQTAFDKGDQAIKSDTLLGFMAAPEASRRMSKPIREAGLALEAAYDGFSEKTKETYPDIEAAVRALRDDSNALPGNFKVAADVVATRLHEWMAKTRDRFTELVRATIRLKEVQREAAEYASDYGKAVSKSLSMSDALVKSEVNVNYYKRKNLEAQLEVVQSQIKSGKDEAGNRVDVIALRAQELNLLSQIHRVEVENERLGRTVYENVLARNATQSELLKMILEEEVSSKHILEMMKEQAMLAKDLSKARSEQADAWLNQANAVIKLRKAMTGGNNMGITGAEVELQAQAEINKRKLKTQTNIVNLELKTASIIQKNQKIINDAEDANAALVGKNLTERQRQAMLERTNLIADLKLNNKKQKQQLKDLIVIEKLKEVNDIRAKTMEKHVKLIEAEKDAIRLRNEAAFKMESAGEAWQATYLQMQLRARNTLQEMSTPIDAAADTLYDALEAGAEGLIEALSNPDLNMQSFGNILGRFIGESLEASLKSMAVDYVKRAITGGLFNVFSGNQALTQAEQTAAQALANENQQVGGSASAVDLLNNGLSIQETALTTINQTLVDYLSQIAHNTSMAVQGSGGNLISGADGATPALNMGGIDSMNGPTTMPGSASEEVMNASKDLGEQTKQTMEALKTNSETNVIQQKGVGDFFKQNVGFATGGMTLAMGIATKNQTAMWAGVIQMLVQAILMMQASSSFAKGGVMTSKGPLPLNTYAKGGVATGPQVAIFGEGRKNEAYVPLPDNRSIPVTLTGGGSQNNVSVNVAIDSNGGVNTEADGTGEAAAAQLGTQVSMAVQQELIRQQSPGGLLYGNRR